MKTHNISYLRLTQHETYHSTVKIINLLNYFDVSEPALHTCLWHAFGEVT